MTGGADTRVGGLPRACERASAEPWLAGAAPGEGAVCSAAWTSRERRLGVIGAREGVISAMAMLPHPCPFLQQAEENGKLAAYRQTVLQLSGHRKPGCDPVVVKQEKSLDREADFSV
uniref:Uncharacterized protein n=1 Tax=Coccidioides posadasii RMSCC 3488 TaxID=454284 RepID=A0A0J6FUK2_COCPO|nr:hypothetical protein CPAG_09111 [Coccidioides posadasii RMSCC 3488]